MKVTAGSVDPWSIPNGAIYAGVRTNSYTALASRRENDPIAGFRGPLLSMFDAGLVADAGGEKRASRSGCQDEQERSCDPLSGNRGDGVFHTI
jgi:hypothetical protein